MHSCRLFYRLCLIGWISGSLFAVSTDTMQGLRALQQIRNLIPDRFSQMEFHIIVDQKGIEPSLIQLAAEQEKQSNGVADYFLGASQFYVSRWTISGDAVALPDSFEEFEYGPYWKYPTLLDKLENLETRRYRRVR